MRLGNVRVDDSQECEGGRVSVLSLTLREHDQGDRIGTLPESLSGWPLGLLSMKTSIN
jgi:hypothetical protein